MKMRLATSLLVPALAFAQVPLRPTDEPAAPATPRPPGAMRAPTSPPATPPTSVGPGTVGQQNGARPPTARPTSPAPRPGGPAAAGPTPTPQPSRGGEAETTLQPANGRCVPLQGRFMLTFNRAEVVDVLEQASRWTCRNFIYTEDVARGKITLLSKTPVTAEEAYSAFIAALNANNITVYPTGRYWRLGRTADSKKMPIPTYTDPASGTPASEQVITKVIRLQYADADQLRGVMGNFISPQGADIQSIPPSTLVITDTGLNIRRIERMIEAVDQAGGGDLVRIVQVRYASAKDLADKVNQIFQAQSGRGARAPRITTGPARPGVAAQPAAAVDVSVYKVLPDDRTNKLIVIADEKSFQQIQELVQQLDVPTSAEGGIHVLFLKNANAEELATTLSNLAQGQAKRATSTAPGAPTQAARPPGMPGAVPAVATAAPAGDVTADLFAGDVKITADKTQNALLVQASGADFAAVQRLVEKLDRPRRQVFVEAVIMEVNLRNETELGVSAHGAIPYKYKGDTGVIPLSSQTGRVSSLDMSSAIALGGFLTGYTGPISAELKDLGFGNIPSLGLLIQALQTNSDVNVLSTPHLLATDNEESEITVGQNVPFQSGYAPSGLSSLLSGSSTSNGTVGAALGTGGLSSLYAPIQRQNVELKLKIKPQINEGGNIRLTIEEQTEEIAERDPQLGPTTAKRSVKTQIVARDQSTIVIGGLIQDRAIRSVTKIPFLGSLPILGWLFRDTTTTKQKTNLLLFLTPYIVRDESDYRRIYEKKRQEQQQFIEQFYGRQPRYEVDVDFSRKTGPYSRMRRGVEEETSRIENGGQGMPGERMSAPPATPPATVPIPRPLSPAPAPEEGEPEPMSPQLAPPPGEEPAEPVERLAPQPDAAQPDAAQPAPPAAEPATPPGGAPPQE